MVKGLGEDARRRDAGPLVVVDELLGVHVQRVTALEGHGHHGPLELRAVSQAQLLDQGNVLRVLHDCAAGGVQVGAPAGGAAEVVVGVGGAGIESVHLGAQRLELGERDVAGATLGRGGLAVGRRLKGLRVLGVERRHRHNVGRGVEVALAVTAHERKILGEGNVAFERAGAHASSRQVRLPLVLGELERGASAMADEPGRRLHVHACARRQTLLERPIAHLVYQVIRSRSQLDLPDGLGSSRARRAGYADGCRRTSGQQRRQRRHAGQKDGRSRGSKLLARGC